MRELTEIETIEQLNENELTEAINYLINTDFEKLVFLLYRIDVSELKIKSLLENTSITNAGELIAQAIIARLAEKKASREKYKQEGEISEEDKW
jgi:hypothetical protein